MQFNIDPQTINIFLGVATGIFGTAMKIFHGKLSAIRKLVDDVDDALKDNTVSESEFREIFADLQAVASKS